MRDGNEWCELIDGTHRLILTSRVVSLAARAGSTT